MRRRVAVVGAGISGIAAAYNLQQRCEVTLFEAADRLGGHTDTHLIAASDGRYHVDSGFIVFNERNYPHFTAWLDELGVASKPSDMSFGVRNLDSGLEYGTVGLAGLFAQRRNLAAPRFLRMLADIRRFYREAPGAAEHHREITLRAYLSGEGYSSGFAEDHMGPMCAALWSQPVGTALDIPLGHVVAFMQHHLMFEFRGRPQWRVVEGGSSRYLRAFEDQFQGTIRRGEPVARIVRHPGAAIVESHSGAEPFDAVFVACHSDQALRLLADPSPAERQVLGAIRYQRNHVVVHSDPRVMPKRRSAWASWNVQTGGDESESRVTYWMNRLQSLDAPEDFFVTLNPTQRLERVWEERDYSHPLFDVAARAAQQRKAEVNGVNRTWFCGAYWGWGFHEDGFASAVGSVRRYFAAQQDLKHVA